MLTSGVEARWGDRAGTQNPCICLRDEMFSNSNCLSLDKQVRYSTAVQFMSISSGEARMLLYMHRNARLICYTLLGCAVSMRSNSHEVTTSESSTSSSS